MKFRAWPSRTAMARPVVTSHRRPDSPSSEQIRCPSGLYDSHSTGLSCPRKTSTTFPVASSQRRTLLSAEPEARCLPSGLYASARTGPSCPRRTARALPVATSQTLMVRGSLSTLASWSPDGLMIGRGHQNSDAGFPPGIAARESSSRACRCRHSQPRCFRRRRLEGPPGRVAMLELQRRRGRRDVRPVAFPALGRAGSFGPLRVPRPPPAIAKGSPRGRGGPSSPWRRATRPAPGSADPTGPCDRAAPSAAPGSARR